MTNIPDDELDERLQRLRGYSSHAPASDELFPRIVDAVEQRPSSPTLMRSRNVLALMAASLLLAVGFIGGRVTAHVPPPTSATPTAVQNPALAVQQSGTRLVTALDALAATRNAAPEVRAQNREVTLIALGAVLAAGSSEYPDEVNALIAATRSARQESPR